MLQAVQRSAAVPVVGPGAGAGPHGMGSGRSLDSGYSWRPSFLGVAVSVAVIGESVTPPSTLPASQRAGKLNRTQDSADSLFVSGQEGPIFRRPTRDLDDLPHDWTEWEQVAVDHVGFGPAFEALVSDGCDGWVLLDTLVLIKGGLETPSSPDDLRRIRAGLQQGHEALRDLMPGNSLERLDREERLLLRYSGEEAAVAVRVLGDLSEQLRKLQHGAHRRRSRVRDQYKALLVRYVKKQTGKLQDRLVCELLNGALAPTPNFGAEDEYDEQGWFVDVTSYRLPDDPWKTYSPEAHRRWRGRNKKLIDDPPALEELWEQELKRRAEQRNEPKPQKLRAVR